jgi:hypothetical protein
MIHETQPFHLRSPCRVASGPDDLLASGDRFVGQHHGRVKPVDMSAPSAADDDAHVRPAYFRFYVADKKFRQAGGIRREWSLALHSHLRNSPKSQPEEQNDTIVSFCTRIYYALRNFVASCIALKHSTHGFVHCDTKNFTFDAGPHPSVETAGLTDSPLNPSTRMKNLQCGCRKPHNGHLCSRVKGLVRSIPEHRIRSCTYGRQYISFAKYRCTTSKAPTG